jgi:hypothetical protein
MNRFEALEKLRLENHRRLEILENSKKSIEMANQLILKQEKSIYAYGLKIEAHKKK